MTTDGTLEFIVDASTSVITGRMELTIGDDAPERDPQNYSISGSNANVNFEEIAIGTLECSVPRNATGTVFLANTNAHKYYKIQF